MVAFSPHVRMPPKTNPKLVYPTVEIDFLQGVPLCPEYKDHLGIYWNAPNYDPFPDRVGLIRKDAAVRGREGAVWWSGVVEQYGGAAFGRSVVEQ